MQVLGLSKSCTDADIKRQYHILALLYHPDKNKGNDSATEAFVKIAAAYELLSDPKKRRDYDALKSEEEKKDPKSGGKDSGP